jgi:serine protease Do
MNDQDKEPWDYEDKIPEEPRRENPAQQDEGPGSASPDQPSPHDGGTAPDNGAAHGQNPEPPYQEPPGKGPYSPYGQNAGPYGQYSNPGYGQQPYTNPYTPPAGGWQGYWNPYGQTPPGPPHKHKMGGGLKAFLWILGIVVAGLVVAFVASPFRLRTAQYGAAASSAVSGSPGASSSLPGSVVSGSASSESLIGGVQGDGTDPNAAGITIENKPSGTQLSANTAYKNVIKSVVGVETTVSASQTTTGQSAVAEGTGIIATSSGYILTNAHVVNYSRSNQVKVVLYNNKRYQAKVVGFDKTSDLAVLKINAKDLSPARFGNADSMEIGDRVIAIGNPGGLSYAGSLTGGYISALNREIESHSDNGMTYIQTDAAINPGNSGGPLVNMFGQVIGINSNKIVATGYEGMGFAIPVSHARPIINELMRKGYVSGRCRLGITGKTVESLYTGVGYPQGVVIVKIDSESDMVRAGAKTGDIITAADGTTVTGMDDLYEVLDRHKPGDMISMSLYTGSISGNGQIKKIRVKLLEDKGETQK